MSQRLRIEDLIIDDIVGADSGNEDDSEDGTEDEDLDDRDSEDEDGDEDDEPDVEALQTRISELESQLKKANRRMRAADRAKANAEKERDDARKGVDTEALDKANARITELEQQLAAAQGTDERSIVREAFRDHTAVQWHDPKLAFEQLDLSEIDVEDGKVDADSLAEAIKDLAKSRPYLVKKAAKTADEDEDEEDKAPKPRSGAPSSRTRKTAGQKRKDQLAKQFNIAGRVPVP